MRPLGFSLADKFVKRAGMDYWDQLSLSVVDSLEEALSGVPQEKIFCLTTKGSSYYGERELPLDGTYIFGAITRIATVCFGRLPVSVFVYSYDGGNAFAQFSYFGWNYHVRSSAAEL